MAGGRSCSCWTVIDAFLRRFYTVFKRFWSLLFPFFPPHVRFHFFSQPAISPPTIVFCKIYLPVSFFKTWVSTKYYSKISKTVKVIEKMSTGVLFFVTPFNYPAGYRISGQFSFRCNPSNLLLLFLLSIIYETLLTLLLLGILLA